MFRTSSKRLLSIPRPPSTWQKQIIAEQMKIKMDIHRINKRIGCNGCAANNNSNSTDSNNKKIKHWSSLDFLIATSCVLFSVDIALKLAS
jgi:hypothetical protein